MLSENYTPLHALTGGILIGLGTLLASASTGKTVGISGAFSKVLRRKKDEVARWMIFFVGLVAGAGVIALVLPAAAIYRPQHSLAVLALAGVLVGFGTRVGGGCTSGYGVSGIGMGSKSGIVATLVFIAAGMLTVYVINHLSGGSAQ
ncbi:MAG: YeeE/YedE thiosulfate transporter family protein [Nibricoccus sp.]